MQVEEEWKEVEEERRDYTGLKIGQLTINEDDQDQEYGDGDQAEGEAGTGNAKGGDPWKKGGGSGAPVGKAAQAAAAAAIAAESVSQVYVSPAMKAARLRGKGIAPDLANEDFFPSLGAEKPLAGPLKKGGQFEEIKHGARPSKQTQGNVPLSINNRYTSLDADGS